MRASKTLRTGFNSLRSRHVGVAERLGTGLQILLGEFDSRRPLHLLKAPFRAARF